MVHLDYRDARPIYAQIADGFRDQIRSGVLKDGERLPSVRELAMELTINPNTIQRAYRELEVQGWIASVPGKGSFVAERDLALVREQHLKEMEQHLQEAVRLAAACGLNRDDLINTLRILTEEE